MPLSILLWACLAASIYFIDSLVVLWITSGQSIRKSLPTMLLFIETTVGWALFYHLTHT